ncbi:MAG: matrixin family metalloprotease [Archangiaceae bacterium]|nr:matrixin family metalloprotease [Archangiaceae bacterium]
MRALALVVLSWSLTASAFELRTDSQGDVVKWQKSLVFVIDPALSQKLGDVAAASAVRAAVAELDDATPELTVSVKDGEVHGPGYDLDAQAQNQNEIIALTDWPYTDGALASTVVTVNARTNEIIDTDIVFNCEQHTFKVLTSPTPSTMEVDDVQNTITHEIGHALGLMHNPMDEDVVMFPRAAAGEVTKRVLRNDDRRGLEALYSTAPVTPELPQQQVVGCSSSGGGVAWALGLAVVAVLAMGRRPKLVRVIARRSHRRGLAALLIAGASSIAFTAEAQPQLQTPVGVVVVKTKICHRTAELPGLIVTSMDTDLEACATATCDRVMRVTVPGGKLGDLEQSVEHHPVPALGERLGLAKKNGRIVVYRLVVPEEASRFNALLLRSAAPQPAPSEPAPLVQPAVSVK